MRVTSGHDSSATLASLDAPNLRNSSVRRAEPDGIDNPPHGAQSILNAVVDERRERRLAHAEVLELERLLEAVEEPLAAAEYDGRDDDRQLVDQPGCERLPDDVGAAHDVDVLAARRLLRALDRLRDALDEREGAALRLLLRPMRDDEEW